MRVVGLLSIIVLVVVAAVLVSAGPASAQGSGIEPTGGSSVIRTRSEGASTAPRVFMPALADLKAGFRFVFDRYRSLSWLRTVAPGLSGIADLPARRKGSL